MAMLHYNWFLGNGDLGLFKVIHIFYCFPSVLCSFEWLPNHLYGSLLFLCIYKYKENTIICLLQSNSFYYSVYVSIYCFITVSLGHAHCVMALVLHHHLSILTVYCFITVLLGHAYCVMALVLHHRLSILTMYFFKTISGVRLMMQRNLNPTITLVTSCQTILKNCKIMIVATMLTFRILVGIFLNRFGFIFEDTKVDFTMNRTCLRGILANISVHEGAVWSLMNHPFGSE